MSLVRVWYLPAPFTRPFRMAIHGSLRPMRGLEPTLGAHPRWYLAASLGLSLVSLTRKTGEAPTTGGWGAGASTEKGGVEILRLRRLGQPGARWCGCSSFGVGGAGTFAGFASISAALFVFRRLILWILWKTPSRKHGLSGEGLVADAGAF